MELKQIKDDNIYQFIIEDKLNEKEVKSFYQDLQKAMQKNDGLKLLAVVKDFPAFQNFKTLGETLTIKKEVISAIEKYAIVSDKNWVEALLPVSKIATPGIPIKHFPLEKTDDAVRWLEAQQLKEETEDNGLSIERKEGTNIYEMIIDGQFDEVSMTAYYNLMKGIDKKDSIKLLIKYQNFDGFDKLKSLITGTKGDLNALLKVDKIAILTDEKWLKQVNNIVDLISPGIDIKSFALFEEKDAFLWLK